MTTIEQKEADLKKSEYRNLEQLLGQRRDDNLNFSRKERLLKKLREKRIFAPG